MHGVLRGLHGKDRIIIRVTSNRRGYANPTIYYKLGSQIKSSKNFSLTQFS